MRRSSGTPALRSVMRVLNLDRAAHRVDHAAELDQRAVAGALHHAPVVHRDRRVDEIAAQRPEPRQGAVLVRAGQPAEADDVGGQDRREFAGFAHGTPLNHNACLAEPVAQPIDVGGVAERQPSDMLGEGVFRIDLHQFPPDPPGFLRLAQMAEGDGEKGA